MEKNKHWAVFDCETDSFDGSPIEAFIYGVMLDTGEYFQTYDYNFFIAWLKSFDGIVLAHNGGKFDTMLLVSEFNGGTDIKIINGRVAEVKIGLATVRDSYLIIPAPLAASGKKDDFDYSILARDKKHLRGKHKSEIERYLRQDCAALHELVSVFYKAHGQRLTQAGAALAIWETEMGKFARRWGGAHDTLFRQFYYGGRCQAFQKGALGNGWNYLDIKSAYPWAMSLEHSFCHVTDYKMSIGLKKLTPQSFARIHAINRGCLPTRGKFVTEFGFDDSPREYFATGWEILAGLRTNTLQILDATVYTPALTESLGDYVQKYYAEKLQAEKNGDSVRRLIAKIFLNSLYGKFGQNAADFKKYKIVDIGACPDNYSIYMEAAEFDIIQTPSGGQFFDVALSASITGCVRAYLFEQMFHCDDLAYCDTDALIFRGETAKFSMGENLGQWEMAHVLDKFYVAGKKLYTAVDRTTGEEVRAHKGFSKLDVSRADIITAATGGVISVARSAPTIKLSGKQHFINRTMKGT